MPREVRGAVDTLQARGSTPDRQRVAQLECYVNFPYNSLKVFMFPMGSLGAVIAAVWGRRSR